MKYQRFGETGWNRGKILAEEEKMDASGLTRQIDMMLKKWSYISAWNNSEGKSLALRREMEKTNRLNFDIHGDFGLYQIDGCC